MRCENASSTSKLAKFLDIIADNFKEPTRVVAQKHPDAPVYKTVFLFVLDISTYSRYVPTVSSLIY